MPSVGVQLVNTLLNLSRNKFALFYTRLRYWSHCHCSTASTSHTGAQYGIFQSRHWEIKVFIISENGFMMRRSS